MNLQQPGRKRWPARHKFLTALTAGGAIIVISTAAAAGGHGTPAAAPTVTAQNHVTPGSACPKGMAPDVYGVCEPGGKTPALNTAAAPPPDTTPAITVSEQQAADAAQGYLDMGSGFSAYSLDKQLTSKYGDGFSEHDAQFAIRYLHPDWDAQAVDAAQGYMQMGGFSRASLIGQLTSQYGDGFTEAQAEYAANQVGL